MRKILDWTSFNESADNDLTVIQQNELEDYLYSFCGFDKEDLDESDVDELRTKYTTPNDDFSRFLDDLDSQFDWFSYKMVPKIIEIINEIIDDYYVKPNSLNSEDEDIYDIGDLVDFGKWGKVYVLAFLDDGILVSNKEEDRFLGEEGSGFIIPDNDIDVCKLIERAKKDTESDGEEDDNDDWWKK